MINKASFTDSLFKWHKTVVRPMPWKNEKDPYKIWISEIILQQTRVNQGWKYYLNFIEKYPTVIHLANAPLSDVMKNWEGLGYYSRARNLHEAAITLRDTHQGVFPQTYQQIKSLKGVGDYTASAIASFAFHLPYPVLDGNVFRIISRLFAIREPVDIPAAKKIFKNYLHTIFDSTQPAQFNQAIMDFGALQCVPLNPDCLSCPLNNVCIAFLNNQVDSFPVKSKVKTITKRYFHFLIPIISGHTLVMTRSQKDIWQGLYQFPLIEDRKQLSWKQISTKYPSLAPAQLLFPPVDMEQLLTHRRIISRFFVAKTSSSPEIFQDYSMIPIKDLHKLAFPKTIKSFLQTKNIS